MGTSPRKAVSPGEERATKATPPVHDTREVGFWVTPTIEMPAKVRERITVISEEGAPVVRDVTKLADSASMRVAPGSGHESRLEFLETCTPVGLFLATTW